MKFVGILIIVGFVAAGIRAAVQLSQGFEHGLGTSEKSDLQEPLFKKSE
jgi:hypothetical protein